VSADQRVPLPHLVGQIILETQEAERLFKVILPFIGRQDDPSLGGALQRARRLTRTSFGELAKKFAAAGESNDDFATHLQTLVDERNRVVHHFAETYGPLIAAGRNAEVSTRLRTLLANVRALHQSLAGVALVLLETMLEGPFSGTDEYRELSGLCADLRARVEPQVHIQRQNRPDE
jgi:hypothetical protein